MEVEEQNHGPNGERAYIKRIELENFMSHRKFTLDLGPNLNVIIGQNGSGKSAILTALTVGLGGSTAKTKRGSGLSDLIKHGTQAAYITVKIHNPVTNRRLRPYGHTITVIRRITAKSSSISIKDQNLKTLSTRTSDLKDINLCLGFYPDNVLAMLNQESAKEFLISSSPRQKYDGFMDALRLTSIQAAIDQSNVDIEALNRRIDRLKSEIDLAQSKVDLEGRWLGRMREAQNSERHIAELRGKLVWLEAKEAETILSRHVADKARWELELQQIRSKKSELTEQVGADSAALVRFDETYNDLLAQQREAESQLEICNNKVSAETLAVASSKERVNVARGLLDSANSELEEIDNLMTAEAVDNMRQELTLEASSLRNSKDECITRMSQYEQEVNDMQDVIITKKEDLLLLDNRCKSDQAQLESLRLDFRRLNRNARRGQEDSRSITAYPAKLQLPSVIAAIEKEARWKTKPIGPLGSAIKVKDAQWSPLLETALDHTLNSFWVTNESDGHLLKEILKKARSSVNIIIRRDDNFDMSHLAPAKSSRYTSFMDLLEFENDSIKRLLIDTDRIESCVCVEERDVAFDITQPGRRVDKVVFAFHDCKNGVINRIGSLDPEATEARTQRLVRGPKRMTCLNESVGANVDGQAIQALSRDIEAAQESYQTLETQRAIKRSELRSLNDEMKLVQNQLLTEQSRLSEFEEALRNVDRKLIELPVASTSSESRRETIKDEKEVRERRLKNLQRRHVEQEQRLADARAELRKIQVILEQLQAQQDENQAAQREAQKRRRTFESQNLSFDQEIARIEMRVETISNDITSQERKFKALIEKASVLCLGRLPDAVSESRYQIEERIAVLEACLAESRADSQEIERRERELAVLQERLNRGKADFAEKVITKTALEQNLADRLKHRDETIAELRAMVEEKFRHILLTRAFSGELVFNDDNRTLDVLAAPRLADTTRTATGLSGGEKSFTQLSLLLSIWHSMSITLVAMDEYDVFMDRSNRRMSLEALIVTVRAKNLQGIFITPQDVEAQLLQKHQGSIQLHRLRNPTRDIT